MSLFKIPLPAWFLKEQAVLAGANDARDQIESAQTDDERRLAEQKLTRFVFTAKRLKAEHLHREALARMLAA